MVLEKILPTYLLEKKTPLAFLLGFFYTSIGIISAKILFPEYLGIVSIAFASILILPSMNKIFEDTANITSLDQKPGIINFLKDNKYLFKVYFFLFCGIFFAFTIFTIITDSQAGSFFEQQVGILGASKGSRYHEGDFTSIFNNNLLILLFCLSTSLLYGSGAIFILSWNAFLWGTIFGSIAKEYGTISSLDPLTALALSLVTIIPHMAMEVSGYIFAAISGGLVSVAVKSEDLFSSRFNKIVSNASVIFIIAIIFILAGAFLESNIFPWIESKKSYLTLTDQIVLMTITFLILSFLVLKIYQFTKKNEQKKK